MDLSIFTPNMTYKEVRSILAGRDKETMKIEKLSDGKRSVYLLDDSYFISSSGEIGTLERIGCIVVDHATNLFGLIAYDVKTQRSTELLPCEYTKCNRDISEFGIGEDEELQNLALQFRTKDNKITIVYQERDIIFEKVDDLDVASLYCNGHIWLHYQKDIRKLIIKMTLHYTEMVHDVDCIKNIARECVWNMQIHSLQQSEQAMTIYEAFQREIKKYVQKKYGVF